MNMKSLARLSLLGTLSVVLFASSGKASLDASENKVPTPVAQGNHQENP